MLKRTVKCPLCFEEINISDIGYKCDMPGCNPAPVFRNNIPFLEKIGLMSPPKSVLHTCGNRATTRICPKCKREVPVDVDGLSNFSIAIIGAKGSGKSHYVTMLIHKIKQLGLEFDWSLTALTDDTITRYRELFYRRLFEDRLTIESTAAVRSTFAVNPLIYSLNLGKNKRIMLVFFDAAGENLEQTDAMWYINRYIYNASGIICLLDPLQLRLIRQGLLRLHSEDELPKRNGETGVIINRVENLIRKNRNIGAAKINIPLAVAFSKMDFIKDSSDNAEAVSKRIFEETRHQGYFNNDEFEDIDGLMRSWVQEVDDTSDILGQARNFKDNAFFGFSALGCNPVNEKLDRTPRSYRVEDPFLWILKRNGLI